MNYFKTLRNTALLCMLLPVSVEAQTTVGTEQFTLDNGLTVILNPDHTNPEVFGVVITRAGSKDDPADATGLAHYMEHMLFKGTQTIGTSDWAAEKPHIDKIFNLYSELGATTDEAQRAEIQQKINDESQLAGKYAILNETSALIKQMGGTSLNAGTGPDQTLFYNAFPPNQMERWLALYAERFHNPVFRQFQAELEVIYEEKNMYSDMFFMNLLDAFKKNFFRQHPYGQQNSIGTIDHLKNPSLKRMKEFFDAYYVPNNMALILSGDFDAATVKPLVAKYFGAWERQADPIHNSWEEQPFNGRELVEAKLTPVKMGILGYRTVPAGHDDLAVLKVIATLCNNETQSGLLDKLSADGKVMAAQAIPMSLNDHGAFALFMVPKIIGQKTAEAEKLVLEQLDRIKKGDYPDWLLESARQTLANSFIKETESNEGRALVIASAYSEHTDLDKALQMGERIKRISRHDVSHVAKKYFGDNYLAFFSRMGFPNTPKIAKPDYEPVVSNTNATSPFAQKITSIPATEPVLHPVDFDNDVTTIEAGKGVHIYHVNNPKNDLFTLKIAYGSGQAHQSLLPFTSALLNHAGAGDLPRDAFRQKLAQLGCSISTSCSMREFSYLLEGPEENLGAALNLLGSYINHPVVADNAMDLIRDEVKSERKMEATDPSAIADALVEYLQHGEQSEYLDRPGKKALKKLKASALLSEANAVRNYEADIHFTGKTTPDALHKLITDNITFSASPLSSLRNEIIPMQQYNENTLFFVPSKKANQSSIYFLVNGQPIDKEEIPAAEAFNIYFGGDFSGLVLQEIREYRSMAYTASGRFRTPRINREPMRFSGYIGTQADKTVDAINIFNGLIRDMPEKPERMPMIRSYLAQSIITSTPDFRDRSQKILRWRAMGYHADPSQQKVTAYNKLSFDDIMKFYRNKLKDQPVVIAIVGDPKRIDMDALKAYGKIIQLKQKKLYTK